jgi:hypothetical protein
LRSGRSAAGRHAFALFVGFGMARWIRAGAGLLGPGESRKAAAGEGAKPRPALVLPTGVVRELVPALADLVLGPGKGVDQ